jgi:hypothetical protein
MAYMAHGIAWNMSYLARAQSAAPMRQTQNKKQATATTGHWALANANSEQEPKEQAAFRVLVAFAEVVRSACAKRRCPLCVLPASWLLKDKKGSHKPLPIDGLRH